MPWRAPCRTARLRARHPPGQWPHLCFEQEGPPVTAVADRQRRCAAAVPGGRHSLKRRGQRVTARAWVGGLAARAAPLLLLAANDPSGALASVACDGWLGRTPHSPATVISRLDWQTNSGARRVTRRADGQDGERGARHAAIISLSHPPPAHGSGRGGKGRAAPPPPWFPPLDPPFRGAPTR